jgi:hypothetical protein
VAREPEVTVPAPVGILPRSRHIQLSNTRLNHGFLRHNDCGPNTDAAETVYYARNVFKRT